MWTRECVIVRASGYGLGQMQQKTTAAQSSLRNSPAVTVDSLGPVLEEVEVALKDLIALHVLMP